jgi:hypothetical protein
MRTYPIIFSGPMVRALLDGSKTQTRRIAPIYALDSKPLAFGARAGVSWRVAFTKPMGPHKTLASYSGGPVSADQARSIIASQFCPYGGPGDRLWVREAWRAPLAWEETRPKEIPVYIRYEADLQWKSGETDPEKYKVGRLRPSIHLPKEKSRITLEITAVRVERLQDISEADAVAEGIIDGGKYWYGDGEKPVHKTAGAVNAYRDLWAQINGPGNWDLNPWVWVISFNKAKGADA